MAHVFLLNSTVVFWPERNVLYAKSDETKRITLSNPATFYFSILRLNSSTWQFYTSRSPSVFCQR